MADTDPRQTTTTSLNTALTKFKPDSKKFDEPSTSGLTVWDSPNWKKYHDYYKAIPELKKSVDALAMWAVGRGWTADARTTAEFENIRGWGEDSIDNIWWNLIVTKKINGDAVAEIVSDDEGNLINLKVLSPNRVRWYVNPKGSIERYEVVQANGEWKTIDKKKIFHISNDRIANEIHGTSMIECCQWVIDARNEAMNDKRRTMHRMTIRILEVDFDDTTTMNKIKTEYATAINKGEVMLIPKGTVGIPDVPVISTAEHSDWIRYLEGFFYKAAGVSETILGGTENTTEAASKVATFNFEQPYMTEQRLLEQDIWNQLKRRIKFERPNSLKEEMQQSEAANTGQVGFQPNDTQVGKGK